MCVNPVVIELGHVLYGPAPKLLGRFPSRLALLQSLDLYEPYKIHVVNEERPTQGTSAVPCIFATAV